MPPKLIATDLDGTLLGADHEISSRTATALETAKAAGATVVFATGRSHFTAAPIGSATNAVDWMLCSNGATLFDARRGEVAERQVLQDAVVQEVFDILRTNFPKASFAWETEGGFVWNPDWKRLGSKVLDNSGYRRSDPHAEPPTGASKVLVGVAGETSVGLIEPIAELMPDGLYVSASGAPFVEITAEGANKGAALARLCAMLDIAAADVIAFGDNHNDLTMLAWAGHAVAMPHADKPVKALANEVAERNDSDGVARIIERLYGASG